MTHNELDQVQRRWLCNAKLRTAKEKYGVNINLDAPTRGQRLEAALAMREEAEGWYSMEIMGGKWVGANDLFQRVWLGHKSFASSDEDSQRRLYAGFALSHQYCPKEEEDETEEIIKAQQ